MSQYKLIYFNLRGRGEVARLIFTYACQEFEDYRVKSKDWPKYKPTTPVIFIFKKIIIFFYITYLKTGKLPILEIKDENNGLVTRLVQSRLVNF
jgi:hypothetical protein